MSFLKVIYLHRDLIFDVKEFTILLLSVIFVTLIAGSVQSIYADHILKDGKGIFKDQNIVNLVRLGQEDSKYNIHLLVEVRTAQDQLISISEAGHSQISYIGYELMSKGIEDLGKKEIVTIDGTKFEKVQHVKAPDTKELMAGQQISNVISSWQLIVCVEIEGHGHKEQNTLCIPFLQGSTGSVFITEEDVVTNQWTILRELD